MELVQQTPNRSDFDVVLEGNATPSFRMLLPECVLAQGEPLVEGTHVLPGEWEVVGDSAHGTFDTPGMLGARVCLEGQGQAVAVSITIRNRRSQALADVRVAVCVSPNHLPGAPDWCNTDFLPGLTLDRDVQGRHWFEKVTPAGLKALIGTEWVGMHPCPEAARADDVPKYSFQLSETDDACACAVASADGRLLLFQAWAAPCFYCAPFPGNACMHLLPLVAEHLEPGEAATVRGIIGMFPGNHEAFAHAVNAMLGGTVRDM